MKPDAIIAAFLLGVRALDATGAGLYFLDLLDLIEQHREALRHAPWPADFDPLETSTYRAMLLQVEEQLRGLILELPLATEEYGKELTDQFQGVFVGFLERADAVSTRLAGGPLLQ